VVSLSVQLAMSLICYMCYEVSYVYANMLQCPRSGHARLPGINSMTSAVCLSPC
jgi:hypothetical protein